MQVMLGYRGDQARLSPAFTGLTVQRETDVSPDRKTHNGQGCLGAVQAWGGRVPIQPGGYQGFPGGEI